MKNKTKRFIAFSLLHFFLNGLIFTTIAPARIEQRLFVPPKKEINRD